MRVQERPYKLPANIFQAKLKMSVLVDGMVTAVKRRRSNIHPLLVGNFVEVDKPRGITRARRRDRRIKRMRERIAQGYTGRRRLHRIGRGNSIEHAGLGSHVEERFYTECATRTKEVGKEKRTGDVCHRSAQNLKSTEVTSCRQRLPARWRTSC